MGKHSRVVACLLFVLSACGDDPSGVPVADGGAADAEAIPAPPEIPWLAAGAPSLELAPCPAGWRETSDSSGVVTCEPYPVGGRRDCARGEAHFPGEPACRAVGGECGATTFAEPPAGDTAIYVDASAGDGGDGSRSAPFDSLSDVDFGALGVGTTVLLARGVYPGSITLRPGVRVLGACAAETVLTGDTTPVPAVVTASARGEPARIERVAIRDAPKWAVFARGGATLHATHIIVDRADRAGVLANERGSEIVLTDALVQGTRPGAGGNLGFGLEAAGGASITAEGVVLSANHTVGVRATEPDTTVTLRDAAIVDTRTGPATGSASDIEAQDGATVIGERVLLGSAATANVVATSARVEVADAVLVDAGIFGVFLTNGASARLARVRASSGAETVGGVVVEEGSRAELVDVVVRDFHNVGVGTLSGEIDASRLVVERIDGFGVAAEGVGGRLDIRDSVVRDTAEPGLAATNDAEVNASRVVVSRATFSGAAASSRGRLELADVVLREGRPDPALGDRFGMGLFALDPGAVVNGQRVVVDEAYEIGVVAYPGSMISLSDLFVRGVLPTASGIAVRSTGFSVAVFSAAMTLERFHLANGSTCGLILADHPDPMLQHLPTSLDLTDGLVEGMAIGACVQVDGYDLGRLQASVVYRDNGANLDTSDLPVPELPDPTR